MVHQLLSCKKADTLDHEGQLICTAAVHAGGGNVLLSIPSDCELPPQADYVLVFYHPVQGLITCRCALAAHTYAGKPAYTVEVLERLSRNQRRADLKVSFEQDVHVRLFGGNEFSAETVNLSAGGVCLRSVMRAFVGDRIFFSLNNDQVNLLLIAEILRVVPFDMTSHPPVFEYGCRFVELSPGDEEMLRSFVFRLDLNRLK